MPTFQLPDLKLVCEKHLVGSKAGNEVKQVNMRGERLTNPIVLSCSADTKQEAAVSFKFGIQNQNSEKWEMGAEDKVRTYQMWLQT